MGVESGSQKILNAMEKGTRVSQVEVRTKSKVQWDSTLFLPSVRLSGRDLVRYRKNHRLIASAPDDIGVSVSYPLPGTAFFERFTNKLVKRLIGKTAKI